MVRLPASSSFMRAGTRTSWEILCGTHACVPLIPGGRNTQQSSALKAVPFFLEVISYLPGCFLVLWGNLRRRFESVVSVDPTESVKKCGRYYLVGNFSKLPSQDNITRRLVRRVSGLFIF